MVLGLSGVFVALAALITLAVVSENSPQVEEAEAGDCVKDFDVHGTHVGIDPVDCADSQARHRIVARIDGDYYSREAAAAVCDQRAGRGAWNRLYLQTRMRRSSDNFVLCMDTLPLRRPASA